MAQQPISSLAIAGAWGYIGRKFVDAANQLQLTTNVYDVGEPPSDLDLRHVVQFEDELMFYGQQSDLFHLALHPEHRATGMNVLLQRSHEEPIYVLCEKPMAAPESPGDCSRDVQAIARSPAVVLYDFPELFDPITHRILDFLRGFKDVRIASVVTQRSKDREDPANPRNAKRMVHIQYQESVHCLAFALYLLAHVQGGMEPAFADGLTVRAESQPYRPPNPSAYAHVVDGMCEYEMTLGETRIDGRTDFKRGASWAKRRVIKGTVDGRAFCIEADFLEDRKRLLIDDRPHDDLVHTNSYAEVIKSISRLRQSTPVRDIMGGLYPNPNFARVTYQLSSLLWKSCWEKKTIEIASLPDLLSLDVGFKAAQSKFERYR